MPVSRDDVLYALLALDAYNRHADPEKVKISEDDIQISERVGNATWQASSDEMELTRPTLSGSQLSGFSASWYEMGAEKVISYRGTDFDFGRLGGVLEFLKDFGTGWLTSFNVLDVDGNNLPGTNVNLNYNQPHYAEAFYEIVTQRQMTAPPAGNVEQIVDPVTLVGHSLGGALAGYVGSLTDDQTKIFNEIPYIGMALNTAISTFIEDNIHLGLPVLAQAFTQIAQGEQPEVEGVTLTPFNFPEAGGITSFRMDGEVAYAARFLGPVLGLGIELLVARYGKAIGNYFFGNVPDGAPDTPDLGIVTSAITAIYSAFLGPAATVNEIDPHMTKWSPSIAVGLHSQALMTIHLFGQAEHHSDWYKVGNELYDALNDGDVVGASVGAERYTGYAGIAEKMAIALAYSSIAGHPGLVFGNSGIRALFDDVDELGAAYAVPNRDAKLDEILKDKNKQGAEVEIGTLKKVLVDLATQYAGALALGKVEIFKANTSITGLDIEEGVIGHGVNKNSIAADLSSVLWHDVFNKATGTIAGQEGAPFIPTPVWAEQIRKLMLLEFSPFAATNLLGFQNGKFDEEKIAAFAHAIWNATDGTSIDRFHFRVLADEYVVALSDRSYKIKRGEQEGAGDTPDKKVHIDAYHGTDEADKVYTTLGNDLVFTEDGDDDHRLIAAE